MNRIVASVLVASGLAVAVAFPYISRAQTVHTGTVERVWEDGLSLNTGDRTLRVDTWDLYGDSTPAHISVGDELTISGEFEGGEFDAFSIEGGSTAVSEGVGVPASRSPGSNVYTGTVQSVWEDGLSLNTGDRTLRVDTWDLYGDSTPAHISVGDELTISGEFEGGEFDAFTIDRAP
ncbi:hypothetical protein [Roseofilum capinflatum]|uniref:DUF5666 domain-containing protein n=1 Tax=Roseofilum capinflatum BLCC-M114 TaxID=3022440 RepID=A0ABT7B9B5_9CYAN|nr:hypothetical protein [Roseofilum capinflatum]MDJ1175768.1 hypothetical protein [Roseofilum capinflatum BLCC-M114]